MPRLLQLQLERLALLLLRLVVLRLVVLRLVVLRLVALLGLLLLQRVVHEVRVVRDVLALVRELLQVLSLHALHVNQ